MSNIHYWARMVETFDDIPEVFRNKYKAQIGESEALPYTLFLPSDRWGNRPTNEKVICLLGHGIAIFEKKQNDIGVLVFEPSDIDCLQRRSVLLHSWLTIKGNVHGRQLAVTIEYNTVVKKLFDPILKALRLSCSPLKEPIYESDLGNMDYFKQLDYRFRHYSRESLMNGQKVISMHFQPAIYKTKMYFFKEKTANPHLNILTDTEWIFICEGELKSAKEQRYEDTYTFMPLARLKKIKVVCDSGILNVKVVLEGQAEIAMLFEASKKKEMDSFFKAIQRMNRHCSVIW